MDAQQLLKEELQNDVRQSLALERTILANERTLMSYLRTALAISGGGLTIQHFSNTLLLTVIGYALIPLGLVMGLYGWRRYQQRKHFIEHDKQLLGLRLIGRKPEPKQT